MGSVTFRRVTKILAAAAFLGVAFAVPASAQITGKIQGRVTDAQTAQPIAGAQVIVMGTRFGNITDQEGRYFVNFVPAGLHDIQIQFIGYRTVTITNQRVLAGQTTDLNFQLESTAVEVTPIEVVGEREPLVPRDQVASKAIISGEDIDQLPVDDARAVIKIQPGVVETRRGLSIRGAREGENAVYIEGVLVRNYSTDAVRVNLPTNAFSEVDVITGGFSVEFGESQGGIINFVTRTGGRNYTGALSYQTDEISPDQNSSFGVHRWEGSVGGPLVSNLSFFVAGSAQGNQSVLTNKGWDDVDLFVLSGVDTTINVTDERGNVQSVDFPSFLKWDEGRRLPFTANDQYSLFGKLTWSYGAGSNISGSYSRTRDQGRSFLGPSAVTPRAIGGNNLFNPIALGGGLSISNVWTLAWTQNFVRSAESSFALDAHLSYQRDRAQSGQFDQEWALDNRSPAAGFTFDDFEFMTEEEDFPGDRDGNGAVDDDDYKWLMEDIRVNGCALRSIDGETRPNAPDCNEISERRVPFQGNTAVRNRQPFRMNPFGMAVNFPTEGIPFGHSISREDRFEARANLDWQINRLHRLKLGGEFRKVDAQLLSSGLDRQIFMSMFADPNFTRASLYGEDRVDLGDVVVFGGLRWDYFTSDARYPRTPFFVFNLPERITADTAAGCETSAVVEEGVPDPCFPDNWFVEPDAKNALSPRLGVSFPVTERSTFRLSYGHFVRTATLDQLFSTIWTDLRNSNTNDILSRDLDFGRVITFEFGYRQQLGVDAVLDLAAYNTDTRRNVAVRKLPFEDPNRAEKFEFYNVFTNLTFGNNRGVDIRLDKRFGNILDVTATYGFVRGETTDSDPFVFTRIFARQLTNLARLTGEPIRPAESLLLSDQTRTHNVGGSFSLTFPDNYLGGTGIGAVLENVGVFGLFRFASGLPYSRLVNVGVGQVGPPTTAGLGGELEREDLNTFRTEWIKEVDLRVTKGFNLGAGSQVRLFADVRNLFDFRNVLQVFLETGETVNELHRDFFTSPELARLAGLVDSPGGLPTDVSLYDPAQPNRVDQVLKNLPLDNGVDAWGLIRAEERWGNGDGFFSLEEQEAAFNAAYNLSFGEQNLLGPSRQIRFGIEWTF